jgi:flagellar protein FliO/FliZ
MVKTFRLLNAVILLIAPVWATAAEGVRPPFTPPPSAVSSSSIVQITFSLILVLAAIVLVAWLLKRLNVARQGSGHLLKILGGVAVGQRERIVLVEVHDTWLVVGVGPGQIRTLHALQKQDFPNTGNSAFGPPPSENKFANLLLSVLRRRPADGKHNAP